MTREGGQPPPPNSPFESLPCELWRPHSAFHWLLRPQRNPQPRFICQHCNQQQLCHKLSIFLQLVIAVFAAMFIKHQICNSGVINLQKQSINFWAMAPSFVSLFLFWLFTVCWQMILIRVAQSIYLRQFQNGLHEFKRKKCFKIANPNKCVNVQIKTKAMKLLHMRFVDHLMSTKL